VVVPWYTEEWKEDDLRKEVLRSYFYPILAGRLEVLIETPKFKEILDSNTLPGVLAASDDQLRSELRPLADLARWALNRTDDPPRLNMPPSEGALRWTRDLFPAHLLSSFRGALMEGEKIAVRVPLTIRDRQRQNPETYFDVYLMRDESDVKGRPVFIRQGIIICDVHAPRQDGVPALVVVEDPPMAALLGDAEGPAHTQWQKDSSHFKARYNFGPSHLKFVANAAHEILKALAEGETEKDPRLLIDFFSLESVPEEEAVPARSKKATPKPGAGPGGLKPEVAKRPKPFRLETISGGFRVSQGEPGTTNPQFLEVLVGYDVRRGSSLRKYHTADFRLDRKPIRLEPDGVDLISVKDNKMVLAVRRPEFSLRVSGFDEKRDVYVKVSERSAADDSQG
jgi:hypothetical protein